MHDHLQFCLTQATNVSAPDHLEQWCRQWLRLVAEHHDTLGLALRGGFAADRLSWASAAGYQAALRHLIQANGGVVGDHELLAMCATEATGNRPRDINTVIREEAGTLRVSGEKSWTTLGPACTALMVAGRVDAEANADSSRPTLKIAKVRTDAGGVTLEEKPPLDFAPEMSHAVSTLDNAKAEELLPGDGYSDFVKPFRALEDAFISLSVQAWLLREARARGWPASFMEKLLGNLVGVAALIEAPADAPITHLALAGALERSNQLYQQADQLWAEEGDASAERWQRDRPLFQVASRPRALRVERAWQRLRA